MNESPLSLKTYYLSDLEIHWVDRSEVEEEGEHQVDLLGFHATLWKSRDDPFEHICQLTIDCNPESPQLFYELPWSWFKIALIGYFKVSKEYPSKDVDALINKNAPMLLYSAAREALATMSGRFPFRTIILPIITAEELSRRSGLTRLPKKEQKRAKPTSQHTKKRSAPRKTRSTRKQQP